MLVADDSNCRVGTGGVQYGRKPAFCHIGVIVQKRQILSPRLSRRLIVRLRIGSDLVIAYEARHETRPLGETASQRFLYLKIEHVPGQRLDIAASPNTEGQAKR